MALRKKGTPPRAVIVSRNSIYEQLLERHATRQQAAFFLKSRGQSLDIVARNHVMQNVGLSSVRCAIPKDWRWAQVNRRDLERFDFEERDLVIAVGQDGLVANLAKYLCGQSVIGINPDEEDTQGLLCAHHVTDVPRLLAEASSGKLQIQSRSMVAVRADDGQSLLALNEIFVGHKSHQSARYRIEVGEESEVQSSSGLIVSTGTGSTGWARSIARQRDRSPPLPGPCDPDLTFFVRECFPSPTTGTTINSGCLRSGQSLVVTSHMNEGGVIFGDGIETDRIHFHWGMKAEIVLADCCLELVV